MSPPRCPLPGHTEWFIASGLRVRPAKDGRNGRGDPVQVMPWAEAVQRVAEIKSARWLTRKGRVAEIQPARGRRVADGVPAWVRKAHGAGE